MEIALVIACTLSILLSGASIVWVALFSSPAFFRTEVSNCRAEVASAALLCAKLQQDFLAHKAEMNGIAELVEGLLEQIERKRKSTVTAASRLDRSLSGPIAEPVPQTVEELRNACRKAVYGSAGA